MRGEEALLPGSPGDNERFSLLIKGILSTPPLVSGRIISPRVFRSRINPGKNLRRESIVTSGVVQLNDALREEEEEEEEGCWVGMFRGGLGK